MNQAELIQKLTDFRALPGETESIEFKEARSNFSFKEIGQYFSALSNEACLKNLSEAWLIFGVKDADKSIVGSNYRTDRTSLDSLKAEVAQKTTNGITFIEIHELNLPEGRVIMFQIPAAPQGFPIAWEKHYYGRDGESLTALNIEEIERLRMQKPLRDWSGEICESATINDLDKQAIQKAREIFKIKNPRLAAEVDRWDNATFLNKARITIGGKITNTAVLLLGKPESEHFLGPAIARISWVLKDKDNTEKDYEHFTCPLLLSVDSVFGKIRNLKYRYIKDGSLFPEEVDQYDPLTLREALQNCIAHQDYLLAGRIHVIEREDGILTFSNLGEFIPGSIENVIQNDEPPQFYRNNFLVQAMVNLNMIDTIGSGIKKMFLRQSEKFFPLPDYEFDQNKVKATITGKVLDIAFASALANNPNLSLIEIFMLDKVQKKKPLTASEISYLKDHSLIEGRKPNFHISSSIADSADKKADYIKIRGLKDQHYKDLILQLIDKYGSATKEDIDKLLLDILPSVLSDKQKENKVRNLVYAMSKRDKVIINTGGSQRKPVWKRLKIS